MYEVKFTKTALKNFNKLDKRFQKAAAKAIDKLAANPQIGKPLTRNLKGYWKLRFSRYRIIYQIKRKRLIIIIFDVKHRKRIYKKS